MEISLTTFQAPVEKPLAPEPEKAKPQPKPAAPEKPLPRPQVQPRPIAGKIRPKPASPMETPLSGAPAKEPVPDETAVTSAKESTAAAKEGQVAIQVSVPRYDVNPPPKYPRAARRRNYQGTVLLEVRVTVDGRAAEVKVARSSGHALLDESALAAVRGWLFTPARRGALPIETWVAVPVRFELR